MTALGRTYSRNDTALEVKGFAYSFDAKQNYLSQQNVVQPFNTLNVSGEPL